ncbi:MAG: SusC/RagA family TonB-linked outer membrane protein [Longimicrobiales bacterium]
MYPADHLPAGRRIGRAWFAGLAANALLAASFAGPAPAAAQATGSVRGTVIEAGTQQPLVGAQVSVEGTQRGGLTDSNGSFLITGVPVGTVTVRVESIGYRSVEQQTSVADGQAAVVNFELQQSAIGLDEIVVTGTAGRTTKRAIGNSVGSIDAAQITEAAPINNVQQLIQGRTPGVTLFASSGVVGGSSRIRIRGASSLTAGNEPVIFIDGVRVQSGTASTEGNTAQGISLLESINPNDIESIEVIKGPAAATLYGAEAATGVIQIITKKGRPSEGLQWNANFEYGQVDWSVDRITTYWLCTDANIDNPSGFPGCQVFDKSMPLTDRILIDHPLEESNRSAGVNKWLRDNGFPENEFTCRYPVQQPCRAEPLRTGDLWNTNLAVRGGGENYNFYISGERSDEQGTFFNNINRRNAARANFGFVPSQQLNFAVNVGYSVLHQQIPQSDNSSNSILRNAFRGQAGGPAPTASGFPGYRGFSPEWSNKHDRQQRGERLTMGVTANYNPFSWFQNRLTVGLDRNDRENRSFDQIDLSGLFPNDIGDIGYDFPLSHIWTVDYTGTVSLNLAENWTSAFSGGMQMTKRRNETVEIEGEGLVSNNLNLVSAAATRSAGQDFSEQTSLGFYVQEQVGWKDRLFATAAVRVDDNSAFGKDFSLVVYPKASLSYVISEEDFFNVNWIDELKLRGAWGQAGNAPGPFSADRTYETGRTVVGDVAVNRLQTDAFGNRDLKAETGQELELGFDASFLGGRIGADVTYYYKRTKDALLSVSDPPSSGWTGNHLVNVGEIKNSGFELGIEASPVRTANLQWDAIASFSTNSNELISFGKNADGSPILLEDRFGPFVATQRHREGYPLGGFWAQDVERDAQGNIILNASGQAIVPTCVWPIENEGDCSEEFKGPMLPTRQLGLTNTFTLFQNLRVYSFFDYQGGHWQWCAICSVRSRIDRNTQAVNDPNTPPDEMARLLSLQTEEFIYPSDFIKLRELSATYTLPRTLTSRFGFERASITLSGRNLWMWTKYDGNSDPEVTFTSTSEFDRTDYGAIPQLRRLLVSMAFNF